MPANPYSTYFKEITSSDGDGTEYTYRTYFQNLLNEIKPDKDIKVIHEPTKDADISGRPDFKIEKNGLVIGYIETKPLGFNLDDILEGRAVRETEQLKKYVAVSPNLILTNYNKFILFKNGQPVYGSVLFESFDKRLNKSNIASLEEIFKSFFTFSTKPIVSPKRLSHLLAERTKLFRDFLKELLEAEEENEYKDRLIGLKNVMERTLIENLSQDDFIDAYAQTITYGLFLAEINSKEKISDENAHKYIPKSMGILRDLFKTIDIEDIPNNIDWILDEIMDILNRIDRKELKNSLSFSELYDYEDPYVYFYENFLGDYDQSKRKSKGVYYTPIPIVKFIVNSINYLLKENFNPEGLKGEDIKVLDFATGTGTFLLEAFDKALENTDVGMKGDLIHERLLKNYHGFEYLIAPYTIAHLKLSQYLEEIGYSLKDDERFKIYLTDTLDISEHKGLDYYFARLNKEGIDANIIKSKEDILVMMGNPPYSNYSSGVEKEGYRWIKGLLNDYKEGLNEKKINIDDDYIKFLRYAQWKIQQNGFGIVGVITNNSYLDGITHRVMRKSLLDTFDEIYILNLHGNKRRLEPDENVFDVMVGVNIALFVKLQNPLDEPKLHYYSTLDNNISDRETKYGMLLANSVSSLDWIELNPVEPTYWFVPKKLDREAEYEEGWKITDIFVEYNSGIQTGKDSLVVDYDKDELLTRIEDVLNSTDESETREKYNLKDTSGWTLSRFKKSNLNNSEIIDFDYRPFDNRWIYYGKYALKRDRYKTMKNFIDINNLGLVTVRQVAENKLFNHTLVTDKTIDMRMTTSRWGTAFVFPLFIHEEGVDKPKINFSNNFFKFIIKTYRIPLPPIGIFSYIYAILNAPTYRERYNEFLKTDYPRILFTKNVKRFKLLAKLGKALIDTHLLKHDYYDSELAIYEVEGDNRVDKIRYDENNSRLYINKEQYFENVPKEVWEMEMGGYQVIKKWLQYRKKDEVNLSYKDRAHLQKVIRALDESLSIVAEIDQVYKKL
jgi:predicted helicase